MSPVLRLKKKTVGFLSTGFVVCVLFATCGNGSTARIDSPSTSVSSDTTIAATSCMDNGRCVDSFCEQVAIEKGSFVLGEDEETKAVPPRFLGGLEQFGSKSPARVVSLPGYCIDKYEVTWERYAACVAAGVCDPGGRQWLNDPLPNGWSTVVVNHYPSECGENGAKCPHHPVNCKTYRQAETYCKWIGRRLCTEAEWERTARGPVHRNRTLYPWGSDPIDGRRANTPEYGPGHLVSVDSYPEGVSHEGVFNLVGNVFEWVSDDYAPYNISKDEVASAQTTSGNRKPKIARGGCFFLKDCHNNTDRLTLDPAFDWGCIGVRCCSDMPPSN